MKSDNSLIKPALSFDEPVEMLRACHERIAAQCATLEKLAAHLPLYGPDTQAQQAARNIMRYFDVAGPHHHADEEQDLFPMLIEISQRQCSPVGGRIAFLLDEHRSLEAAWVQLRAVLANVADGKTRLLERRRVADFVGAYRAHRPSAAMVARRTITPQ